MRIETIVNCPDDFEVRRRLENLPALTAKARAANCRILKVESAGQDCAIGPTLFERIQQPYIRDGQRTGAIRFGDPRAMALAGALWQNLNAVAGFTNRSLRTLRAGMLGTDYGARQMTCDMRRLRLHGLIERGKGYRYRLTRDASRRAGRPALPQGQGRRPGRRDPRAHRCHGVRRRGALPDPRAEKAPGPLLRLLLLRRERKTARGPQPGKASCHFRRPTPVRTRRSASDRRAQEALGRSPPTRLRVPFQPAMVRPAFRHFREGLDYLLPDGNGWNGTRSIPWCARDAPPRCASSASSHSPPSSAASSIT